MPVAAFLAVTDAPVTIAPFGSATVPRRSAVLACACAKTALTLIIITIADSKNLSTMGIKNALICFLSPSNYKNFFLITALQTSRKHSAKES
jgi:hypothetical protein